MESDFMTTPSRELASGFSHSFDTGIASTVGVNAAIVYNHILYWLRHNFIEGKNFEEEKTWMYNSFEKMAAYMPYFTKDQVRRSVEDLIKFGLIIKSSFNKSKFDHTSWYSVADQSIISVSKNVYDEANLPHPRGMAASSERRSRQISYTQENPLEKPTTVGGGAAADRSATRPAPTISFDKSAKDWIGITEADLARWAETYPSVDIQQQLREMREWLINNPADGPKSKYGAFIARWFAREQDKVANASARSSQWQKANASANVPPPPLVGAAKSNVEMNRQWAKELADEYFKKDCFDVNASDVCIWIKKSSIGYAEHGFREQVNNALRKFGLK